MEQKMRAGGNHGFMSYMADPFRLKAPARTSDILRLNSSEYSKIVRVNVGKLLLPHIKGEENDAEQSAYYMRCRNTPLYLGIISLSLGAKCGLLRSPKEF